MAIFNTPTVEAAKLNDNQFRRDYIVLANALTQVFAANGIDIWEVLQVAKAEPFGTVAFYPSPRFGGRCIRFYPFYLSWCLRGHGIATRFENLAGDVKSSPPQLIVAFLAEALNRRGIKSVEQSLVLILVITSKRILAGTRARSRPIIVNFVRCQGVCADHYDPFMPIMQEQRQTSNLVGRCSSAQNNDIISAYDVNLTAPFAMQYITTYYGDLGHISTLLLTTRNATIGNGAIATNTSIV